MSSSSLGTLVGREKQEREGENAIRAKKIYRMFRAQAD
jgi:hypothetical protein